MKYVSLLLMFMVSCNQVEEVSNFNVSLCACKDYRYVAKSMDYHSYNEVDMYCKLPVVVYVDLLNRNSADIVVYEKDNLKSTPVKAKISTGESYYLSEMRNLKYFHSGFTKICGEDFDLRKHVSDSYLIPYSTIKLY